MLTERQSRILGFIIGEYVEHAVPVASQYIEQNYPVGASAATIRSEMAELEEQGYLNHPHTSSGRVPTGKGYRLYVESLMREEELPWDAQQTILHQFHQIEQGQESWAQLAAAVLAQSVENAAVVTTPRMDVCRIKHLELVSLHDMTFLLVLVLDEGRLEQQVLSSGGLYAQEELSATAAQLNRRYEGKTSKELAGDEADLSELELLVMEAVHSVMRSVDEGGAEEAYLEGLRHILSQPEFSDSEAVLGLLELLDGQNLSRAIPLRALAREGVTVIIGADSPQLTNASEAMRACSVIVGSYGAPGEASGALAVVGPMRMRYSRTISTVRYLADVMSELLSEQYEGPTG